MNTKPKIKVTRMELRLAPNQKDELRDRAIAANLTMSEYIVYMLNLPAAEYDD